MSVNTYAGRGWLISPTRERTTVSLTLFEDGVLWCGVAQPAGRGARFPTWAQAQLVVTVRLSTGSEGQARIEQASRDRTQPATLVGIGPWPR